MFPTRVRRMVLDSTVDPRGVWYADNFAQDYAFQGRMTAFLRWAARYNADFRLGGTPAAVSAGLRHRPVPAAGPSHQTA